MTGAGPEGGPHPPETLINQVPIPGAMRFIRKGKVKEVHEVSDTELEFRFTNQISVFDKVIPTLIPRKGESLARTSAHWFQRVEEKVGVKTHFLGLPAPDVMRVRRIEIPDVTTLTPESTNVLIPLEVVCRHYVAGTMHDRLKRGVVKPSDLGFTSNEVPEVGTPLPEPLVEFTTKLEKTDRDLGLAEAQALAKLSDEEFEHLKDVVLDIDAVIADDVEPRGLIHVDGKKEFAYDENRELMLVDTFGTADEDRFWDKARYEATGERVEYSKEFVRQYYRKGGYHEKLMEARHAGQPEPDIPALPDDVTAEVSRLYGELYEKITGKAF